MCEFGRTTQQISPQALAYFLLWCGFGGIRLTPSSDAFVKIAPGVRPSFRPITGVGVSCFASFFRACSSADVHAFPVLRMYLGGTTYSPFRICFLVLSSMSDQTERLMPSRIKAQKRPERCCRRYSEWVRYK